MHDGSRQTRTLVSEVRRHTAGRNPLFVGWHRLKISEVPPRERYRYHVLVSPSWREPETQHMPCVSTPTMFA